MINGVHAIFYSRDVEAVRGFFRDVLECPFVDAGRGWLIFALPPAELAVHPTEGVSHHEVFLMCEDVYATVEKLKSHGVAFSPITEQGWGLLTRVTLPGGEEIGLYEPKHPTALKADEAGGIPTPT
jgi:predicted enzyme related to lactoylglutathione lyase